MTTATPDRPVGNPFCTRHVRPGRLPSFDAAGQPLDLARLLARLAAIEGSAAIVGPHGSGKTTLLGHLADVLEAEGRWVTRVRIGRSRDVMALLAALIRGRRGGVVCVDSWEKLGLLWTRVIRCCAAASSTRLLVTAHNPGQLPILWQCTTTPALLGAIVAVLPCGGDSTSSIQQADVDGAYKKAEGNIREALFLLYDTFEARTRFGREAAA